MRARWVGGVTICLVLSGLRSGSARTAVLAAVVLAAAFVLAQASAGQAPTCQGRQATLTGAGTFSGTVGNDVIVGSAGVDRISALEGNDTVCGLEGNDTLIAAAGADVLDGGAGADLLEGGDGADRLLGIAGDDVLRGGPGPDNMAGGAGIDLARLGEIPTMAGIGETPIHADADNVADDGHCCPAASEGDNVQADIENISGGENSDTLTGSSLPNRLIGGRGADTLTGLAGADVLEGGLNTDTLSGGDGADTLLGDEDTLGDTVGDIMSGGAGNDLLDGGQGSRTDSDVSEEELRGPDRVNGGPGVDTVTYAPRELGVEITLDGVANDGTYEVFSETDFQTRNCDDPDSLSEEEQRLCAGLRSPLEHDNIATDVENVLGGNGGDFLTGNEFANRLVGGRGKDGLDGLGGADRLETSEPAGTMVEPDSARCGAAVDTAIVDLQDVPVGFPDCELVEQAAIDQHPGVRIARRASLLAGRSLVKIRLRCPRKLRRGCRGRLSIARVPADRAGVAARLASRRYRRIAPGGSRTMRLRLSRGEQRLVRRLGRVRATALERDPLGRPKRTFRTLSVRA